MRSFPVVFVSAFAATALAQAVPSHALSGVTPIHTAPADPVGGAYGTWGAGDAYKASFHAGMTFVPYLGRDYPVTRSVTWQTESAVLGGTDLRGAAAARHSHDAMHYEYHFAGVVETYEVRAEGLEQSFVVARPGTGELRIVGRLGGNLQPIASADGTVAFVDGNGQKLVTYGTAVAIDRTGRRFPVDSLLDGDLLSLRVAPASVAAAQFPLVIDPLLATNLVGTHPTADPDSVDVARDDATNDIAVCYLRHVSAVDQDAWVRQFTNDFANAPGGVLVFTDINTWGIQNIRICNVGPADDWVAVVNRSLPVVYLRYWVQPTTALVLNTTVSYAANAGADNQWFADIGGIEAYAQTGAAAVGTSAMCVYMQDDSAAATPTDSTTIWAQRIDVAGAAVVMGAPFQISAAGNDHDFPSICKVSEGQVGVLPARWIAVWQRYDGPTTAARDWDVVGTQVFDDDTAAGTFEAVGSTANDMHRILPKVEGQRGRYLVAYAAVPRAGVTKAAALQGKSMVAQRFDWPTGGAATSLPPRTFRGPALLQQMIIADVAYDADTDSHWTVMDLDTVDGYLRVHRLGHTAGLLVEQIVSGVPVGEVHNGLGGICYDDDANRFVLAYGIPLDGPMNPVYGQYFTFPAEVAPSLMGPTCRPILPQWEGRDQNGNPVPDNDQQIGDQFTHLRVTGTPVGAIHFMMLSTATAFVPIIDPAVGNGCMQLLGLGAGFLGVLPVRVGSDVEWPVLLLETLPAFTLHAQDVFLDPAVGLFFTSYRLDVPLVK